VADLIALPLPHTLASAVARTVRLLTVVMKDNPPVLELTL
jgi:hypothetical protein